MSSTWTAKTGELVLDRAIVMREVGFYALGIVLLYVALRDVEKVEDDDVEHIFISFWEACMVFSGYILYVIVCANMDAVVKFFGGPVTDLLESSTKDEADPLASASRPGTYGSATERTVSQDIDVPTNMQFLTEKQNLSSEPASNWNSISLYLPEEKQVPIKPVDTSSDEALTSHTVSSIRASMAYQRSSILVDMFHHTEPPSKTHDLYEMRYNEVRNKSVDRLVLPWPLSLTFAPSVQQRVGMLPLAKILLLYKG